MPITISYGKDKLLDLDLGPTSSVKELKAAFAKATKVSPSRQSFRVELPENDKEGKVKVLRFEKDSAFLADLGYTTGMVLRFKDLGAQIGYRTVFVLEYAGPIVIILAYASRPALIYGEGARSKPYSQEALLALACWLLHFLKREFETFFVHRFSRPTMPLSSLFKNCYYYWGFGLAIGYFLAHPNYKAPPQINVLAGLIIFLLSELGNMICHIMLRNLRPAEGSKERPIPSGFLFDLVSSPNYFFEVLAWVGFCVMTHVTLSYVFTAVGFGQMLDWALKKHAGYLKEYGDKYKKLRRKAMVPFVI